MLARIDELVGSRADFMFETTLATLVYSQKIPMWRRLDYAVSLIYLRLP
jgi:predicted ABC-type ATPase